MNPMLASPAKLDELQYPIYASPKLDGIRGCVVNGRLMSRTDKLLPNKQAQELFGRPELEGLDGELMVGNPAASSAFIIATSHLRSTDAKSEKLVFYVFDLWNHPGTYEERQTALQARVKELAHPKIVYLTAPLVEDAETLLQAETLVLEAGYEGLILRSPKARYKHGRSTVGEQGMLKVKRFVDAECVVLGVEEEVSEVGLHKGTAGALHCRVLNGTYKDVEFSIGTGFTLSDRKAIWRDRAGTVGRVVKFACQEAGGGGYTSPRFPSFKGFREGFDFDKVAA